MRVKFFGNQCYVFSNINLKTLNHAKLFGIIMEKVAGGWRKVQDKELHHMHSSTNIIRVTEMRRMKWVGHLAYIGESRNG
jgi:hypothetical protein